MARAGELTVVTFPAWPLTSAEIRLSNPRFSFETVLGSEWSRGLRAAAGSKDSRPVALPPIGEPPAGVSASVSAKERHNTH